MLAAPAHDQYDQLTLIDEVSSLGEALLVQGHCAALRACTKMRCTSHGYVSRPLHANIEGSALRVKRTCLSI